MVNNKTILVTGGAGFIGANLIRKLAKSNNQIHLLVKRNSDIWRIKELAQKLTIHYESLLSFKKLTQLVKKIKPQIIYHLAAHGAYPDQNDPLKIIENNILGTANLIMSLNAVNYQCFINTGSSSEYGFKKESMKETDLLVPVSFYAASKASGSYIAGVFAKIYSKPIITLRPFSVYGPYEKKTRLIPAVINNIMQDHPVKLAAQVARRDFIYIDDFIDCLVLIPLKINKSMFGQIYNVGTGKQYTNEEIIKIIMKLIGKKVDIIPDTYQNRPWDTDFWVADINKVRKTFNWKPKYNLEQGLSKTINWFKQNEKFYTN